MKMKIKSDNSIKDLMARIRDRDSKITIAEQELISKNFKYLKPKINEPYSSNKLIWRGVKIKRKSIGKILPGLRYLTWIEQRGNVVGRKIRTYFKNTGEGEVRYV